LLPNNTSDIEFAPSGWTADDLKSADEVTRQIIRDLRARKFWPPVETPEFAEDWVAICQDHVFEQWEDNGA
jgi:hypothetical protein